MDFSWRNPKLGWMSGPILVANLRTQASPLRRLCLRHLWILGASKPMDMCGPFLRITFLGVAHESILRFWYRICFLSSRVSLHVTGSKWWVCLLNSPLYGGCPFGFPSRTKKGSLKRRDTQMVSLSFLLFGTNALPSGPARAFDASLGSHMHQRSVIWPLSPSGVIIRILGKLSHPSLFKRFAAAFCLYPPISTRWQVPVAVTRLDGSMGRWLEQHCRSADWP